MSAATLWILFAVNAVAVAFLVRVVVRGLRETASDRALVKPRFVLPPEIALAASIPGQRTRVAAAAPQAPASTVPAQRSGADESKVLGSLYGAPVVGSVADCDDDFLVAGLLDLAALRRTS